MRGFTECFGNLDRQTECFGNLDRQTKLAVCIQTHTENTNTCAFDTVAGVQVIHHAHYLK